jgi:type II secretory pathway pseudopilin PulG
MTPPRRGCKQQGFAMAALLVALAVMSLLLSMALPAWQHAARREREAELIFRGEQYARAIMLYQRQTPGAYPPDVETLIEGRFLRRAYRDPMTRNGEFRLVLQSERTATDGPGGSEAASNARESPESMQRVRPFGDRNRNAAGGVDGNIVGVVSRSEQTSIALYNGKSKYSEWVFSNTSPPAATAGGGEEQPSPGVPGAPGGSPRRRQGGEPLGR